MKMKVKKIGQVSICTAAAMCASVAMADVCVITDDDSGVKCFTLYAGQHIDAGSVCVQVVGDQLEVTFETTGDWQLEEAHLWYGTTPDGYPQTRNGNPIPGQFPHHSGDITGETSYTFVVSLGDDPDLWCQTSHYIGAHAALRRVVDGEVVQTETGWSEGGRFVSKGNWATRSMFDLNCDCELEAGLIFCGQTAFAFGDDDAECFLDLNPDAPQSEQFNRWGWTNGPYAEGTYELELWAAAGQCELEKGELAGTVTLVYENGTATVTYQTTGDWLLQEVHTYVGNERLPLNNQGKETVAPGQYPYGADLINNETDEYEVVFGGLEGEIYLVAHAVAVTLVPAGECEPEDNDD
jgi:hypothetical protein